MLQVSQHGSVGHSKTYSTPKLIPQMLNLRRTAHPSWSHKCSTWEHLWDQLGCAVRLKFHTLLRSLKLSVKLLKCMANMFLFLILILSLVLWGNAVLNAPINKGEYQLNGDKTRVDSTTTGHFGTSLFGATHTFSCCSFHEFPMFKSCTSLWRWRINN